MSIINNNILIDLCIYINKHINKINNTTLINLLRLNNEFYQKIHNNFNIFILYEYLTKIFKIPLNVCDKNTYKRKLLKVRNSNYINHIIIHNTNLINEEFSVFLYVYNQYPIINITLNNYDNLLSDYNKQNIIYLFYYIESYNETMDIYIIKVIFYVKNENKFIIKQIEVDKKNKINESIKNINIELLSYCKNEHENENENLYYNNIKDKLLNFKSIFIYLKDINNS